MKQLNIISGLPRSGTTLLSAVLAQNPLFTTGITDSLVQYLLNIIKVTNRTVGGSVQMPEERMIEFLQDIVKSYYKNDTEICFNTNRLWTANTSLLKKINPNFKMLVCVRDITWILDSIETLHNKDPLSMKPIFGNADLPTVFERCDHVMGEIEQSGFVLDPYKALCQSMSCAEKNQLLFIDYQCMVNNPEVVFERIYNFLNIPHYVHDFNNVEYSNEEFDTEIRLKEAHTVKKKVEYKKRSTILPFQILAKYEDMSFWNFKNFNPKELNWISERTL